MKEFLRKFLGFPGLAIYYVIAIASRIVSLTILVPMGVFFLFFYGPLSGKSDFVPGWFSQSYKWYCMED